MRNLIIFDEYQSSLVNGVGTFVRNLISMMPRDRFNVSLVNMNGPVEEFRITGAPELTTYDFPPVNGGIVRINKITNQKCETMKKFMPLEIREFTPLSNLEMKQIFGGSGTTGSGQKKCAVEGQKCVITYTYKTQEGNAPVQTTQIPVEGTCHTSGTEVTYPNKTTETLYSCVCEFGAGVEIVHSGTAKPEVTTPCINTDKIVP